MHQIAINNPQHANFQILACPPPLPNRLVVKLDFESYAGQIGDLLIEPGTNPNRLVYSYQQYGPGLVFYIFSNEHFLGNYNCKYTVSVDLPVTVNDNTFMAAMDAHNIRFFGMNIKKIENNLWINLALLPN